MLVQHGTTGSQVLYLFEYIYISCLFLWDVSLYLTYKEKIIRLLPQFCHLNDEDKTGNILCSCETSPYGLSNMKANSLFRLQKKAGDCWDF